MPGPRRPPPASVDEYLAAVPPKYRAALEKLRRTIRAAAPEAEETISYGMPAFRQDGMLVYYAAFQDHGSFFIGSPAARRRFAEELRPFAGGKGTVRFTLEHPLPANLVTRIVTARVAENARRRSDPRRTSAGTARRPRRPAARKARPGRPK